MKSKKCSSWEPPSFFTMPEDLLEKSDLIQHYLKKNHECLSPFSFVNLFAWKDFFSFDLKVIDDALCIFAKDVSGTFMYLPPLGETVTSKTIAACFEHMRAVNGRSRVARIENVSPKSISLFPDEKYASYHKGYEYIYFKNDIVQLKGNDFKSKRSDYNFFTNTYVAKISPFSPAMIEECLTLYDHWACQRKALNLEVVYQQMLEDSRRVHETVLKHAKELNVLGLVVEVDGAIKAYSVGYEINPDVFCILFEIADLSYKGLPVFIFRNFAKDQRLQTYKFLNAMDDFGLENARVTKMSFRPAVLSPMYSVKEREKNPRLL
ncbi:MAG: DUF2156 domain-containing protein [Candidatus Omnitrophica bacterium]|nr:DUF2156 domain-containing protein [Candidatus Omnitrophota bacterium]